MDLLIAASSHHGGTNRENPFWGRRPQRTIEFSWCELRLITISTPAGKTGFQRSQRLLERLLETAPDGHGLTHGFHGRGEHRRRAPEFLKGKARNLGDDVIDRRLETGRRLAGDVVENLVEGVPHGEARSNFGNGETGCLAGQCGRSADTRIHLNDHNLAISGVDRELDVATAGCHTDLSNDGNGLISQSLIFPVRQGLGWSNGDRITGVNTHGIKVFDAADNHHVVGEITHDLQLEFLPTQQRLFNQNLRDRTGIKTGFTDGGIFLRVVSNPATASTQSERGTNDSWVGADGCANSLCLLH
ncbi:MAG: Uncharacterised protein [Synechococcus sp. MIT S9220]|nr:MAG: Uncharacterised protein [Synechococcus sp. MIT S9220]